MQVTLHKNLIQSNHVGFPRKSLQWYMFVHLDLNEKILHIIAIMVPDCLSPWYEFNTVLIMFVHTEIKNLK